jgi:hypothetical protein
MCSTVGMTCAEIIFQLGLMIAGIVIALWYGDLGHPRLKFEVVPTHVNCYLQMGRDPVRFPHIRITNKAWRRVFLVNAQTAYDCNGTIEFFNEKHQPIHSNKMPISWSGQPEPVKWELHPLTGVPIQLPEPGLMRNRRFMDIPPGYHEEIDVAVRITENRAAEQDAYGWTLSSYEHNWRDPSYKIPQGNFILRVEIVTGSQLFAKEFMLSNPEDFDKFDLHKMPTVVKLFVDKLIKAGKAVYRRFDLMRRYVITGARYVMQRCITLIKAVLRKR